MKEWEGTPLHLYAIPRHLLAQNGGFPPEAWIVTHPSEVKKSVESLAIRYAKYADYDIIGHTPSRGKPGGALALAVFGGEDDPPGAHGPIVPCRYLTVCKVALGEQLHLTVVDELAFDKRGNVLVPDEHGGYVIAPQGQPWHWATAGLFAACAALWGVILWRWKKRRASLSQTRPTRMAP